MISAREVKAIDATGRRILEQVGIRVDDPVFLDKLGQAGVRVDDSLRRAYLDGDWLDEMVGRTSSHFVLCSRDGNTDLPMGEGRVHFGNGGRVFRLIDQAQGTWRLTELRDVARVAALVERLGNINFFIIPCQAHDLDPESYHLNDFFHAFNHTNKHVMGGCDDPRGAEQMWHLACAIAGDEDKLRDKPFVSVITNPISPLILGADCLRVLSFCCERGIPVTCAPAPISGATAPATLAGTLAQMHAEALAGVAIAQALSPGARVLYGAVPATMDLRKMDYAMASVEMAMMNAAAVQLAQRYRLPIYASAGAADAKRADFQAGMEKTLSSLLVAMAGADYIHLAAGMLDSGNSIAFDQYVIDNECIGTIRRVLTGIRVDDDSLGFEAVRRVGPGGNYVTDDHTVENMMREFFYPDLGVRCNFDVWEERGRPDMLSRARERVDNILHDGMKDLLDPGLIDELKNAYPGIRDI